MWYKLKRTGCYILLIILLPYIVTVFLNGPIVLSREMVEEKTIRVLCEGENEEVKMSVEDYGIGLLAHEIPVNYELETLKVQAIMVRTKIYKAIQEEGNDTIYTEKFLTQEEMKDVWGFAKFAKYYSKMKKAWEETEGQILVCAEELIFTPFFSLSNGSTRDGKEVLGKEYSYLKIKDCPLDIEVPEQLQTVTLDTDEKSEEIKIISTDTAGYVLKVRVGKEEVSGEEFRKNYNLASSCFSVQEYEGKLRITTRGVGHGIGLSQNTANKMAEDGKTAKEILEYFYEGCEIREIADVVNK